MHLTAAGSRPQRCSDRHLPAQVHQERVQKLQADLHAKTEQLQQLNRRLWEVSEVNETKCVCLAAQHSCCDRKTGAVRLVLDDLADMFSA